MNKIQKRLAVFKLTKKFLSVFLVKNKTAKTDKKYLQIIEDFKKFLKKRDAQSGNINFCKFSTTRYEAKEAATGSDFEFKERLTKEAVQELRQKTGDYSMTEEEWIKPFDYMKIFQPKTPDELRRILGKPAAIGSDADLASSNVNSVPDGDLPF